MLLPNSTNSKPLFGLIYKLLCCEQGKSAYLYYVKTTNVYCEKSDLFIVKESDEYAIVPTIQLPDYHTIEVERVIPPIHLHLIFEISNLKNLVRQTGIFVYFELDFYCLCSMQKSCLK